MAIKFKEPVRQSGQQLIPGVSLAFEDANAEAFFVAAGWAEETTEDPVHTYPEGSFEIDPDTRHSNGDPIIVQPHDTVARSAADLSQEG